MLQIRELTLTHKKDFRILLEDFHMVLNDGDKAVIIGEEGNGKSTLMKFIYSPEMVEDYIEAKGIRVIGKERLGYLPQELPIKEKEETLYEFFSQKESFWNHTPKELAALAGKLGVDTDFFYGEQKLKTLSGGEKVKAQLMSLLLEEPTVLLLDEPSNDIDIETMEVLEKLIREWEHIVLFISHDETLIENAANMVILIEQLQRKTKSRYTIARMSYTSFLEQRKRNYEQQKAQALNEQRQKELREEKYRRVLQSVERAQATIGGAGKDLADKMQAARNLKDKMHTVKAMGRRFEKADENMTEMPQQEEAIFFKLGGENAVIPSGKMVLEYQLDRLVAPGTEETRVLAENIFLRVRGPEKIVILGKNGAGKTTLVRKIAKELLSRKDIHAEYMPQNYEELLPMEKMPIDFLDQTGDRERQSRIRTYLGSLKYTADEMSHPIRELSGGQKAKLFLLKMSLSGANVLILDEPTRNFSPLSGGVLRKLLKEFPGAIISISHDRKYIEEVCDKRYVLTKDGLIAEE